MTEFEIQIHNPFINGFQSDYLLVAIRERNRWRSASYRVWPFLVAESAVRIGTDLRVALEDTRPLIEGSIKSKPTIQHAGAFQSLLRTTLAKKINRKFFDLPFEERYLAMIEILVDLGVVFESKF